MEELDSMEQEEKSFLIHENGINRFHIFISDKEILIQKPIFLENDELDCIWEDLVTIDQWEKLFIGYDICDPESTLGNSILINVKDLDYIWIGSSIVRFEAKSKIIDFHSPIANGDNSQPWAVDQNYRVYLGYSDIILCNKEQIEAFDDYVISEIPYYKAIETGNYLSESSVQMITHDYHQSIMVNNKIYHVCCQFPDIEEKKLKLLNYSLKRHPIWITNEFPKEKLDYIKII